MSFQRSPRSDITSSRWLAKNRSRLLDDGIPPEIVESERKWNYVLLHGDDELASGWQAEWLTVDQASQLLEFIRPQLESSTGFDLVRRLESRVEGLPQQRDRTNK